MSDTPVIPQDDIRPAPPPKAPRSKKRLSVLDYFIILFFVVLVGGMVAVGGAVWWVFSQFNAPGPAAKDGAAVTSVVLERGRGLSAIAGLLRREGLISSSLVFRIGVMAEGKDNNLKAGEYAIPSGASMRQIMDQMVDGKVVTYKITFAEGLSIIQMLRVLAEDPVLEGDAPAEKPREGSLLPETYVFSRGMTRAELTAEMAEAHTKLVDALWETRKEGLPIKSKDEAVILASIVEKETGVAAERPRVAAVFVNRLRKGMKLQSDPTIIYGITGGEPLGRGLRKSEIEKRTPYNTYVIDGLPPTPIANPGEASLRAVMNPPDTKELFFVADGTGGHVFAETYDEHQRNVARWRQIEAEREKAAKEQAGAARP